MISRIAMLAAAFSGLVAAQALPEYALGAARAAAAAASAQKLSQSAGKVFEKSGGTLLGATTSKAPARRPGPAVARKAVSAPAGVDPAKVAEEPAPKAVFEDPSRIEKGMGYGEVIRRFGTPPMTLTTGPGQETLCYTSNGRAIDVQVRDGSVTAVERTPPTP
jgi:hypothetical protein